MRLSTRSRYGVRLMLSLAMNSKKDPIFLKDIASKEEISEKYLSQIIIPLKCPDIMSLLQIGILYQCQRQQWATSCVFISTVL